MARICLSAPLDMYLSPIGSDMNDGLSPVTPKRNHQSALNVLQAGYDFACQPVRLLTADGGYNQPISLSGNMIGQITPEGLTIKSLSGNGDACILSCAGTCVSLSNGAQIQLDGLGVEGGGGVGATDGGTSLYHKNMSFRGMSGDGMTAGPFSRVRAVGNYKFSAGCNNHLNASKGQVQLMPGITVTLVGNPTFTNFALAIEDGLINSDAIFVGSGLGRKFTSEVGAIIYTGRGRDYFPGHIAGTVDPTSIYG